ncbi:MAG: hypothetical protein M1834_001962 [Cirrosporium novae-zelandiae]|nr:MAG: hypothetical protein M1834_001962 [Cirrosporium novae-zelandiae]
MALNADITGDQSSKKAIIDIYDAFGIMSQTLQGADLLAAGLKAMVLVPDFFKGEPLPLNMVPMDTDEKKAAGAKFISEKAGIPQNIDMLLKVTTEAKEKWSNVEAWGVFGLCWGGKVVALVSGSGTLFKVSGQAHPARLAKEDAEQMTIPHICLFSHDEPADLVKEYSDVLSAKDINEFETYSTMHHGWMGARADLKNEENAKEYERG